ncbi:C-8 sterol isomerase [Eremomyces bilateralis CBS 781.70]|uniref:C-8 sterol isomerase n=1 Tax=Eremomyces bilateralis CBS 781.70 TaxID=1392243 RepID=A0A6G1GCE7_9PEZI|nr:C-8 sterol isomerase [Eremomyces bilateralis CBS 781.70]KAF1815765.1 C-8 sterol isomerase [Eremomyces bilateralis CBS 781.70]
MALPSWFFKLSALLAIALPVYYLIEKNLDKFYIFDQNELHELAQRAIAHSPENTKEIVSYILNELREKHLNYVNVHEEWMFNNAGGAMGAMHIIHASITEYLIIFGSTVGTEGHSGRHTSDDYFMILSGTQLAYAPGPGVYEPEVYPPGSMHHLVRGTVKQYKMPEGCFALEYARGWIPPMLFFGFADGLTSTLDFGTLWTTTRATAREMIGNLLRGKL